MEDEAPKNGGLRSVGTALDVLACFGMDEELGVSDIARRLSVAKSTVHRVLTTFTERGITEQNPQTGRYRLGLRLYDLGVLVQARNDVRSAALPSLRQIALRLSTDVHLSVPDGADIVYVERIRVREVYRVQMVTARAPSHTTGSGRAIAAYNRDVDQARRRAGFPPRTNRTLRTEAEWAAALERVRVNGFAFAHDEMVTGSASLAVPIFDSLQRAVAAVSVYGPQENLAQRSAAIVPLLRSSSAAIGSRLAADRARARQH